MSSRSGLFLALPHKWIIINQFGNKKVGILISVHTTSLFNGLILKYTFMYFRINHVFRIKDSCIRIYYEVITQTCASNFKESIDLILKVCNSVKYYDNNNDDITRIHQRMIRYMTIFLIKTLVLMQVFLLANGWLITFPRVHHSKHKSMFTPFASTTSSPLHNLYDSAPPFHFITANCEW